MRGSEMRIRGISISFPSNLIGQRPSLRTVTGCVNFDVSNVEKILQ